MLPMVTNLKVSAICLGTAEWGTREGDDLSQLYSAFRDAGGNCFDSAHCYAFWLDAEGASERALGQMVRQHDKRQDVILCTKGCHPDGGEKYRRPAQYMSPQVLASYVRGSLDRLQSTYIDIYFLHRDDPRVPVDEIMDALHEQQQAGRLRHYAASNWQPARLEQAQAYARSKGYSGFAASQILANLAQLTKPLPPDMCALDEAQEVWYTKSQLPVFAFSSTANGYFAKGEIAGSYATPTSAARRQRAIELAAKHNATPNQIALACLMSKPFPLIPIVGTLKLTNLQDAIGAVSVRLTPQEVAYVTHGDHS